MTLNPQQFPQQQFGGNGSLPRNLEEEHGQLSMFAKVQDIVDNVHKIDSEYHPYKSEEPRSPRDQWVRPEFRESLPRNTINSQGVDWTEDDDSPNWYAPLRQQKLDSVAPGDRRASSPSMKPLPIFTDEEGQQTLADGHHRLASMEEVGHTWAPIVHRTQRKWGRLDGRPGETPLLGGPEEPVG